MEIYLTEEIFSRLLDSLAYEVRGLYSDKLPIFIGVGISGVEIVGRMPEILGDLTVETLVCDVRREGETNKVIKFPIEKVKGKKVLIAYVRVDTGRTLTAVSNLAFESGATDVKTLSIAARNGALCFPNFFSFMINDEDNLYLLVDGYPPDMRRPYPPVIVSPTETVRELNSDDASRKWFECGDERIDKATAGEYLYYKKVSKNCKVFVVENRDRIIGLLHYYLTPRRSARIETLAISKDMQGQGIGAKLINFFIDWCRFNGVKWIHLDAFKEREGFYRKLGFHRLNEFEIPGYGSFSGMLRKVF